MDADVISWDQAVILKRNNVLKAVILQKGRKIVFEKLHFYSDNAVNQKYNTLFEVSQSNLKKIEEPVVDGEIGTGNKYNLQDIPGVQDNRELVDLHGKSQSLAREDIINMRNSGKSSDEIVTTLIDKSSSFTSKTVYSQEKYIKKKNKKHSNTVQILKPNARLICEMYQEREPAKICMMNSISVSQLLTFTDIKYNSNAVLIDSGAGMLLAMVMQRLGGKGNIVNLHAGETPLNFQCAKYMNLPETHWGTVKSLPINRIASVLIEDEFAVIDRRKPKIEIEDQNLTEKDALKRKIVDNETVVSNKRLKTDGISDEEKAIIRLERREKRIAQQKDAWNLLKEKKMDALIFCARFHPTNIVLPLLNCLTHSSPFAVYCEYREPLMELFSQIVTSGTAINLNVSDTFSRDFQVLPERTHPLVMMKTSGGFILSGITIAKN